MKALRLAGAILAAPFVLFFYLALLWLLLWLARERFGSAGDR